jgi:putative flippase GtrA
VRTAIALAARYSVFAAIAIAVNLASQWVGLRLYGGWQALPLAMAVGTGAGLVTKYILDKRWIFDDPGTGVRTHARKFSLYTMMGLATTSVFWMTELLFDALNPGGRLKFLGAAIGLVIGYTVKYRLDRRFVFERRP